MTTSVPAVTYSEDIFTFQWEEEGITAIVERFVEEKTDIRAELTVESDHPVNGGHLYYGRLLLMGPQARAQVRNALAARDETVDWGGILEQICTASVKRYREGAPAVDLWVDDLGDAGKYLVRPFVFDDAVNIIYGPGDSGKSLDCLMLAIAVASGEEVGGLIAERSGPVLYLDWEDSAVTHQERLKALCKGLGVELEAGRMIYRRMDASLVEGAREARKDIAKHGIAMVIVDSLGMACGGDPSDAGGIIRTMLAARSLGVPVICIHHIAKDAKDKSTPYGSVYASNEARMSWLVEAEREGDTLIQSLTNHKANRGARHPRQAFKFHFQSDEMERITRIAVEPATFTESKEVGAGGQKWRILEHLKAHGKVGVDEIAEAIGTSRDTARRVLNRSEGDLFGKERTVEGTVWFALEQQRDTAENLSRDMSQAGRDTGGPLGPLSRTPQPMNENEESDEVVPW
jgi:hypothetical protein